MAKIQPRKKKELNAAQQEKALQQLQSQDKRKKVQRVTVDFPLYIYDQVKEETENTGQTIKGFIVGLVREHFAKKNL